MRSIGGAGVVADDHRRVRRRGGRARCIPISPSGCSGTIVAVGATMIRILHPRAEHLARQIDARRIDRRARHEIDPVERLAVAAERELGAVAVRGVVVDRQRNVREHHRLEIERRSSSRRAPAAACAPSAAADPAAPPAPDAERAETRPTSPPSAASALRRDRLCCHAPSRSVPCATPDSMLRPHRSSARAGSCGPASARFDLPHIAM